MSSVKRDNVEKEEITTMLCSEIQDLPGQVISYPHQVAGHGKDLTSKKMGLRYDAENKVVFKLFQHKGKGIREAQFYESIFDPTENDEAVIHLREHIPQFIGVFYDSLNSVYYLGMKDLLDGFQNICACDIKVGQRSYSKKDNAEKIYLERAKYVWREQIGLLITGIRMFDEKDRMVNTMDIFSGRLLDEESFFTDGVLLFLGADPLRHRLLARAFLRPLVELIACFERQQRFHFFSCSLVLAYDPSELSAILQGAGEEEVEGPCLPRVVLRLVDFTRWTRNPGSRDDNCLFGLRKLRSYLDRAAAAS